jgi:predicted metal-dependent hydrolase
MGIMRNEQLTEKGEKMRRAEKYYVSTMDGVADGGIRRLTAYYSNRFEAEQKYNGLQAHYRTLMLRLLMPDNKTRRTLLKKTA